MPVTEESRPTSIMFRMRSAAFDAVLCVTALCHRMNPDPQAIVNEFARVTKPGGLVCLMEPGGKRLWRGHDDVTHTARRFSLAEMRSMVRGAGLELVRATGRIFVSCSLPRRSWASSNAARTRATSAATRVASVACWVRLPAPSDSCCAGSACRSDCR